MWACSPSPGYTAVTTSEGRFTVAKKNTTQRCKGKGQNKKHTNRRRRGPPSPDLLGVFHIEALLLLQQPLGVIPFVRQERPPVHLEDPSRHVIQEVSAIERERGARALGVKSRITASEASVQPMQRALPGVGMRLACADPSSRERKRAPFSRVSRGPREKDPGSSSILAGYTTAAEKIKIPRYATVRLRDQKITRTCASAHIRAELSHANSRLCNLTASAPAPTAQHDAANKPRALQVDVRGIAVTLQITSTNGLPQLHTINDVSTTTPKHLSHTHARNLHQPRLSKYPNSHRSPLQQQQKTPAVAPCFT